MTRSVLIVEDEPDISGLFSFCLTRNDYRFGARTNFRLAWTNTIARPDFSILAPYERIGLDTETIERGNPGLMPSRVMNVDLLGEHFFQDIGLLSGGVFYKRLRDFAYRPTYARSAASSTGSRSASVRTARPPRSSVPRRRGSSSSLSSPVRSPDSG